MKKQKALLSLEPKDQDVFEVKIQAFKSKQRSISGLEPGVIYLGHIPHGFYEEEMKKYFSQFGKVTRLRLARSRKTGGSKGFAFIEFECDEVAKIVADTMNNYLMFEKILKCEFIPPERVRPGFFRGWRLGQPLAYVVNRMAQNKTKMRNVERNNWKRRLAKLENVKKQLSSIGINFDLDVKLPEKKEVPVPAKSPLFQSVKNPLTVQKGKRILEGLQANTKTSFNDADDSRANSVNRRNKYKEVYLGDTMQTRTNTEVSEDFALQTSNVKRRSSEMSTLPTQFVSGTPGKFMLATAEDVAIAARNVNTSSKKNKKKSRNGSLPMDMSVSQTPLFCPQSNSTELDMDSGRPKRKKKGRHIDVKTSTPMYSASFSGGSSTSGDDSSRYTLEIDTSENEITVKTPPKAIKKLKSKKKLSGKSPSSFSVSELSQKSVKFSSGLNSGWKVSAK